METKVVHVVVTLKVEPGDQPENYQDLANKFVAQAVEDAYENKCPRCLLPVHVGEDKYPMR